LNTIDPFDFHPDLVRANGLDLDVGLAEHDEEVASAGAFELARHMQVGVHARLQDRDAPDAVEFGRASIEIEGAGDHQIEPGISRFAGRVHKIRSRHGAEFGTDQDRSATFSRACRRVAVAIAAFGRDQFSRPRGQRSEGDPVFLVRLLHAGGFEVFEHHLPEIFSAGLALGKLMDQAVVLIAGDEAVRRQALDRKWASDANARIVRVRLIVEVFELGLGGDRTIDLPLPFDPRLPPVGVPPRRFIRPISAGLARDLPFLPRFRLALRDGPAGLLRVRRK
jgi:hypothetical protein